jgi:DNA-binding NarL/FixJ family response regulator
MRRAKIQVLIVDDQQPVRGHIGVLLHTTSDLVVAGQAGDAKTGIAEAHRLRPHVVLLDIRMPGLDGVDAARMIAEDARLSDARIVMLVDPGGERRALDALRGPAAGFVLKTKLNTNLVEVVRCVVRGSALPTPSITRALIYSAIADRPIDPWIQPAVETLTDREREVIGHIAAGLSNHEIAEVLDLNPTTMYAYVHHIRTKLAVRERMQLAVAAYSAGLVDAAGTGRVPSGR